VTGPRPLSGCALAVSYAVDRLLAAVGWGGLRQRRPVYKGAASSRNHTTELTTLPAAAPPSLHIAARQPAGERVHRATGRAVATAKACRDSTAHIRSRTSHRKTHKREKKTHWGRRSVRSSARVSVRFVGSTRLRALYCCARRVGRVRRIYERRDDRSRRNFSSRRSFDQLLSSRHLAIHERESHDATLVGSCCRCPCWGIGVLSYRAHRQPVV